MENQQAPSDTALFLPADYSPETLDLVLERAMRLEDETMKSFDTIVTKAGAGVAGVIAAAGMIVGARDILWWRPFSDNWTSAWFSLAELLVCGVSLWQFSAVFFPLKSQMGPDLTRNAVLNHVLAQGEVQAKLAILATINLGVSKNQQLLGDRSRRVNSGFLALFVLVVLVGVHTFISSAVKSEYERAHGGTTDVRPAATSSAKPACRPSAVATRGLHGTALAVDGYV